MPLLEEKCNEERLMQHLNNKEHLFALMAEGHAVITPNNRLSEFILKEYFNRQNQKTLDKPICLPYRAALIKAYEQLHFINSKTAPPILLNNAQCQHLWRSIIKSQQEITYSEGLLQSVISAWETCEQWGLAPEDPSFYYTPQTRQFQQWWHCFNQQLSKNHFIAECQVIPYLLHEQSLLFSQAVIWACFDDFTPQQKLIQQHLEDNGLTQYQYDLEKRSHQLSLLSATNDKEEYQQLISWLENKIQEGHQRIGVVVPDLQQKSTTLQRLLAQNFSPHLFNLSLGQSLGEFPLVAHALAWIHLDGAYLNNHQASLLLQSPYIGSAQEEFIARSEYLQESKLLEDQTIPLAHFIQDLLNQAPKLSDLLTKIKPYPKDASIEAWIYLFQERLNHLGFPGEYGLNSENYQCMNRFSLLFDEFRQFSVLSSHLHRDEALAALESLVHNTIFQAQKTNAPIQISGLLEASGCEFDCLWVMGLTDQCLPQKTHLSAFIPPHVQRELLMPHSLPARELQFAQQTLQRLQNSANSVVFSYPALQGDSPNLPCSLITKLPEFTLFPIIDTSANEDLISIEEDYKILIPSHEQISGGTAILANQAKCPFKAFAEHRLRAQAASQTSDGLDAKERGQTIHKVMELLWQKLASQHQLFNLSPGELEQEIDEAIRKALSPLQMQRPEAFSTFIQEIEHLRLKRLVLDYLEWEKQRPSFSIAAIEQSYTINLAGFDFKVRVDRLDQVADKKWVIDYKSNLPASKPWNEERPTEPQLLLYALLDEQINALLLLQLKAGKVSCSGFSEEKQEITGISVAKKEMSWEDYRNNWREQLTLLAEEFQQGHCPPKPAQLAICQRCDYQNLCRFSGNE